MGPSRWLNSDCLPSAEATRQYQLTIWDTVKVNFSDKSQPRLLFERTANWHTRSIRIVLKRFHLLKTKLYSIWQKTVTSRPVSQVHESTTSASYTEIILDNQAAKSRPFTGNNDLLESPAKPTVARIPAAMVSIPNNSGKADRDFAFSLSARALEVP